MSVNSSPTATVCYNHPNRETSLRCNRCERYICADCAVLTPTGYRCKECIRSQQKIFDTSASIDFPVAFVVACVLSFLASLLAGLLGFWSLLIAPLAGGLIAEVVRRAIHRHRSPALFYTATAGVVCGALPSLLLALLTGNLFGALWPAAYLVLVAPTVYYRLRGIRIG